MHASGDRTLRRGSAGPAATTTTAADWPGRSAAATAAPRCRRSSSSSSRRRCRRPLPAAASSSSSSSRAHETLLLDLHDQLVPYEAAWAWQKRYVDEMCAAKVAALGERSSAAAAEPAGPSSSSSPQSLPASPIRDALVLLQHPPVYTLGAGATRDHLRFDPENPPLPMHRVERGGEVTYHGPGQLVLYPLLDLGRISGQVGGAEEGGGWGQEEAGGEGGGGPTAATGARAVAPAAGTEKDAAPPLPWPARSRDLHWYLRSLEEVAIRALWRTSRLRGERIEGLTGVWVGGAKVAAVGVRARSWCTYHGLALNVGADLSPFQNIIPCGIADRPVGSVRSALGLPRPPPLPASAAAEEAGRRAAAAMGASGGKEERGAAAAAIAAAAAARDPLVAEYRAALLEAFEEVFDARLVPTAPAASDDALMGGGSSSSAWEQGAAATATTRPEEARARASAA